VGAEPVLAAAAADAGGRDQGRGRRRRLGVALGWRAGGAGRRRRRRRGVPQLGHGPAARRVPPLLLFPCSFRGGGASVSRWRSGGGDGSELLGSPDSRVKCGEVGSGSLAWAWLRYPNRCVPRSPTHRLAAFQFQMCSLFARSSGRLEPAQEALFSWRNPSEFELIYAKFSLPRAST